MNPQAPLRTADQRAQDKWRLIEQAAQERVAMQQLLGQWKRAAEPGGRLGLASWLLRGFMSRSAPQGKPAWLLLVLLPLVQRAWPTLDPWSLDSWVSHTGQQVRHWRQAWQQRKPPAAAAASTVQSAAGEAGSEAPANPVG
jgi:hypothetical protein